MIHDEEGVPGLHGRTTRGRPQETSSQKTECWCPSPSTTCRSACC